MALTKGVFMGNRRTKDVTTVLQEKLCKSLPVWPLTASVKELAPLVGLSGREARDVIVNSDIEYILVAEESWDRFFFPDVESKKRTLKYLQEKIEKLGVAQNLSAVV